MEIDVLIDLDELNPCVGCLDYGKKCTGIDGGECEKCQEFWKIKSWIMSAQRELNVTRKYIKKNNLEWDLLSFSFGLDDGRSV